MWLTGNGEYMGLWMGLATGERYWIGLLESVDGGHFMC